MGEFDKLLKALHLRLDALKSKEGGMTVAEIEQIRRLQALARCNSNHMESSAMMKRMQEITNHWHKLQEKK